MHYMVLMRVEGDFVAESAESDLMECCLSGSTLQRSRIDCRCERRHHRHNFVWHSQHSPPLIFCQCSTHVVSQRTQCVSACTSLFKNQESTVRVFMELLNSGTREYFSPP
jgi:hypothetical protein